MSSLHEFIIKLRMFYYENQSCTYDSDWYMHVYYSKIIPKLILLHRQASHLDIGKKHLHRLSAAKKS